MLGRRQYIVAGIVLLATYISADILTPCEKEDDRVADKQSCSRYHICREDPDSDGDFVSDIATCPPMMVFDMVSSACVDNEKGYLQDPSGCNTFYGCKKPRQSSEGYLRYRFECTGELRFDPENRWCTHITDVPDNMCNSHVAVQAILGQEASELAKTQAASADGDKGGVASQSAGISPNQTEASATDPAPSATTVAPPTETVAPQVEGDIETFDPDTSTSNGTVFRVVTPGERPAQPLTDIDKITQVIKGQLLTRRKAAEAASKLK